MHQQSKTLAQLNAECRVHFGDTNDSWLRLLSNSHRTAYLDQLIKVHGFEGPVEAAIAYTRGHRPAPDLRSHSGFIVEDLMALGLRPNQIALLPQYPLAPFDTPEEALGWCYVLERAIAVHEPVKAYVEARMTTVAHACRYLGATQDRTAARWRHLDALLARYDDDDRAQATIVAAAHAGFRAADEWYQRDTRALRSVG